MNHNLPDEVITRILRNRGDMAALMIATNDDPEAATSFARDIDPDDAGELLICALVLGGTIIRLCEMHPEEATPRSVLEATIEGAREELARHEGKSAD